ncbi:MAG: hypothetical protein HYY24_08110 [Verrucomicrobia bacterium]|nr:hypothetical protein [Verrucomicrobiota bacterium]
MLRADHPISRRRALNRVIQLGLWLATTKVALASTAATTQGRGQPLTPADDRFLDELQRASFRFFWEAADAHTGLVKDRSQADGPDPREVASIAATGFGLTALCIADRRGYTKRKELEARVLATLRFLWDGLPHEHGFFYHFVNVRTGARVWQCELSSIDTALLLCGVLTCRQHFRQPEIRRLARQIYERVDWRWMLAGRPVLAHGWKPESGFLKSSWDHYCEHLLLYLLAIGSPTHPIPAETWDAWTRPVHEYDGLRFISSKDPLFIHQFSHAWFDFRGQRDRHADYFENSVRATQAHRRFCLRLRERFPHFSEDLWGISASDSAKGYVVWGGPPEHGPLDGTVVPCAAAGSLPFLPRECLRTLRHVRERYGARVWKRYGFVDAFNPQTNWFAPDVIGIDAGISLLMAENLRTGFVWRTFMKNEEARRAMAKVGFGPVG